MQLCFLSAGDLKALKRRQPGHRAGMIADLPPAEAKAEEDDGGGWRLEADELGHESLRTVQFFLKLVEAEVRGPKAAPRRAKHLSCRTFHTARLHSDGCLMSKAWPGRIHIR